MFVITGASGHIGSQAAEILLDRGEEVRVIGRKPEGLQRLVKRGAEAVIGNLLDRSFLDRAFIGASAVFAMIPPNYTAADFRAYQKVVGKNLTTAIATAGVSHVVNLSSQGADLPDGTGPILGLREQEARLNTLTGVHVLHLRPTYFMENLLLNIPLIQQHGISGSAVRGDVSFAMIATRDIAEVVATRLTRRDFSGSSVQDLLGPRDLTLTEATAVLGRHIGKPELGYVQFPPEEATKGMLAMGLSPDMVRLYLEMSQAISDRRFAVGRPRTPENTTPTTIEAFAEIFPRPIATLRRTRRRESSVGESGPGTGACPPRRAGPGCLSLRGGAALPSSPSSAVVLHSVSTPNPPRREQS